MEELPIRDVSVWCPWEEEKRYNSPSYAQEADGLVGGALIEYRDVRFSKTLKNPMIHSFH